MLKHIKYLGSFSFLSLVQTCPLLSSRHRCPVVYRILIYCEAGRAVALLLCWALGTVFHPIAMWFLASHLP